MLKKILSLVLSLLIIVSCSKKEQPKTAAVFREIPVADFCQQIPDYDLKMSPDGRYIAYTKFFNGQQNLFVYDTDKDSLRFLTDNKRNDITAFQWVNNNYIAFTLDYNADGYHEIYAIQPDRGGFKNLTVNKNSDYRLTDLKTLNSSEFFVDISDEQLQIYTLHRLNIDMRKVKVVAENNGSLLSYLADQNGQLRIATFYDAKGSGILYRASENQPFKPLVRNTFTEVISPLGFADDANKLIVSSNKGRDKAAVYELDLNTGLLGKLLLEDNDADIFEVIKDSRGRITGAVVEKDSADFCYWESAAEKVQHEVDLLFAGKSVRIIEQSTDGGKLLVEISNGSYPGEFYFYDKELKKAMPVLKKADWLVETELAPVKPVVINAEDGLKLFSYITEPFKANGAAVLLIHDGPWSRDYLKYNADAQFLANRGYLVMQVNYRGSLGYGRKFLESGYKEWGRGMINDLAAAAKWLKLQKKVNKIAVMGTSFGGYAAMRSLQLFPDLYNCAVTQSALIDMVYQRKNTFYGENDPANQLFGHPVKDYDLLREFSPYYNYSSIKAPVLMVYGEQDQTVSLQQVDSLVSNLQKQGVVTEYYKKNGDGHGLSNPQNMVDYYNKTENFLNKHLLGGNSH